MKLRQSYLSHIYLIWCLESVDFLFFPVTRVSHFLWKNIVHFCGRRELESWGNSMISLTFSQRLWNASYWNNCQGWRKPLKILCGCVHWLKSQLLFLDISWHIYNSLLRITDAALGGLKLLITWSRSRYTLNPCFMFVALSLMLGCRHNCSSCDEDWCHCWMLRASFVSCMKIILGDLQKSAIFITAPWSRCYCVHLR